MPTKSACVVGAGAAGIAALKECVRKGFKTVCYELDSDVGGIWHRKGHSPTNTPAVWENLVTNTSKFNDCYSDFPNRPSDPIFLSPEEVHQYLKRVIQHYDLEKFIHFDTRVMKIQKTVDHEQTGQWEVYTTERGNSIAGNDQAGRRIDDDSLSRCHKEVFDFIIVCTGYFKIPTYPDVPGIDTFSGTIEHSFNYTSARPFNGKNVLIVGNKFSALDIAGDVGNQAKQVYIALGEGTWILPRTYFHSQPYDFIVSRSLVYSGNATMKINNLLIRYAETRMDHVTSGLRPPRPPLFSPIGMSDDLPLKLMSGKVKAYGRLTMIKNDDAYFQDGKVISGIDTIVFCTGFNPDLSFLNLKIMEESGKMELYRMVFPIREKHNTLALVGHVGTDFPAFTFFETQARFATQVMAGKYKLPSLDVMQKDVEFWNAHNLARTGKFRSYFVSTGILTENIALELGFYPSFWKVFFKCPRLAIRNWYGPIMSAQYRLVGPDNQWENAKKTCLLQYEEGCGSVRNMQINHLNRTDVHEYYKNILVNLIKASSLATVVGVVIYKYKSNVCLHLFD